MEFNYVVASMPVSWRGTDPPTVGAVIRSCTCGERVWYNPEGDPMYGQGLPKFLCFDCTADHYHETGQVPEMAERTRLHLLSLGMSEQDIQDALFRYTVLLVGRARRPRKERRVKRR